MIISSIYISDFCHGRSCHHRSLFVDVCKNVIELYSKTFFKEYFYEYVLELQSDKVPNVRLKLCSILPQLKKIIKLPTDRNLLQQLETCVRRLLLSEKDRDVLAAIKIVSIFCWLAFLKKVDGCLQMISSKLGFVS